jgi:hypothetical protein
LVLGPYHAGVEALRDKERQINQNTVGITLNLKVTEEAVRLEVLESLISDVLSV